MRPLLLAPYYVHWHYSRALKGIFSITQNLMWFVWHFFSIGILLSTLFAPWQRLQEHTEKKIDIGAYVSTLMVNAVMRFVGFLIRIVFIIFGIVAIAMIAAGGVIVFAVWLVLPVAIAFLFVFGFTLLFRAS